MKTRPLISILIPILAVLIITSSCATTPTVTEEKEGVTTVEYEFYLDILVHIFNDFIEEGHLVLCPHTAAGIRVVGDFLDDNTMKYIEKETGYILEQEIADDFNYKNQKSYRLNDEMFPNNTFTLSNKRDKSCLQPVWDDIEIPITDPDYEKALKECIDKRYKNCSLITASRIGFI